MPDNANITSSEQTRTIELNADKEITLCNAFRMKIEEDYFFIDFAQAKKLDNGDAEVDIISRIRFPVKSMYLNFLSDYVGEAIKYEKEKGIPLIPRDERGPEE